MSRHLSGMERQSNPRSDLGLGLKEGVFGRPNWTAFRTFRRSSYGSYGSLTTNRLTFPPSAGHADFELMVDADGLSNRPVVGSGPFVNSPAEPRPLEANRHLETKSRLSDAQGDSAACSWPPADLIRVAALYSLACEAKTRRRVVWSDQVRRRNRLGYKRRICSGPGTSRIDEAYARHS